MIVPLFTMSRANQSHARLNHLTIFDSEVACARVTSAEIVHSVRSQAVAAGEREHDPVAPIPRDRGGRTDGCRIQDGRTDGVIDASECVDDVAWIGNADQ